jgi:Flp pilus assembly pilin Flp
MRFSSRRFSKTLNRAFHADGGATAIEYGLIAGLIALGILGSLIGERGSLNAAFSQVATSVNPQANQTLPSSAIASKWSTKTLSSITTSGRVTTYNFNDGSKVDYSVSPTGRRTVSMFDPTVNPYKTVIIQPDGPGGSGSAANSPYYIANTVFSSGAYAGQQSEQDLFSSNASNTGTSTMTLYYYTGGQGITSGTTKSVNLSDYASYFTDAAYFSSIQ